LATCYQCKKCGCTVYYSPHNPKMKKEYCPICDTIIFDGRYEKMPWAVTLFAPCGDERFGVALGDWVISEVVERYYKEQNPGEKVIIANTKRPMEWWVRKTKPDKVFLNEFYRENLDWLNNVNPRQVYRYRSVREACTMAEHGIYPRPRLPHESYKNSNLLPDKYIVFHRRNYIRAEGWKDEYKRNVPAELAEEIVTAILKITGRPIVIIGNDEAGDGLGKMENIIDLRRKLTLGQIMKIINKAVMYVGKDSGMVHVAAAEGTSVVSWGYTTESWFPKMPKENYVALMKGASMEQLTEAIETTYKKQGGQDVPKNESP
jgi:hypothetical protein